MAELTMTVADTGKLVVEVDEADLGPVTEELGLASNLGGKITGHAAVSLEEALDQLEPTLRALCDRLRKASPDALAVEFGIKLGGETGVILAKGTAEVNFKITLSWKAGP